MSVASPEFSQAAELGPICFQLQGTERGRRFWFDTVDQEIRLPVD